MLAWFARSYRAPCIASPDDAINADVSPPRLIASRAQRTRRVVGGYTGTLAIGGSDCRVMPGNDGHGRRQRLPARYDGDELVVGVDSGAHDVAKIGFGLKSGPVFRRCIVTRVA